MSTKITGLVHIVEMGYEGLNLIVSTRIYICINAKIWLFIGESEIHCVEVIFDELM